MCADTPETPDYKDTLNLPETEFPMRAGLPKREPAWLEHWEQIGVYDRLREKEGRKPPLAQQTELRRAFRRTVDLRLTHQHFASTKTRRV